MNWNHTKGTMEHTAHYGVNVKRTGGMYKIRVGDGWFFECFWTNGNRVESLGDATELKEAKDMCERHFAEIDN